jgi:hypothetical protein
MTTPSTERKAGPLLGTGAQTSWPFTFKVFAATDIAVTIADSLGVESPLTYGVDYNVTLNSNQETSPGGTVTYPISGSPLPVGSRLVIVGNLPYDQPLDLPSGGNFSPLALENQLDRLTMQIQQLREQVGRAVQVSVTTGANVGLPAPSANELIGWDSTGNNLQNFALSELATAVAYATMRYDTFTGDGVETQFTLTADPVTLANLDVAISGVTQVPGSDYSLLNGVLVFASAPPNGAEILARYGEGLVNVGGDSSDIRFLQAGANAVDRTAEAKMREVVSVTDFGADPTGVASSYQAFVDALAASNAVFVPEGTYRVDQQIDITGDKNIFGPGGNNFVAQPAVINFTAPAGNCFSATSAEFGGITIRNLSITGGNGGYAIRSSRPQSLFENILMEPFNGGGIQLFEAGTGSQASWSTAIRNVKWVGPQTPTAYRGYDITQNGGLITLERCTAIFGSIGLNINQGEAIDVVDCSFNRQTAAYSSLGAADQCCIRLSGAGYKKAVSIHGCYIEAYTHGIYVEKCESLSIYDNYIADVGSNSNYASIYLKDANVNNVTIRNNHINDYGNNSASIDIGDGADNVVVENNYMRLSGTNSIGIRKGDTTYSWVQNNDIEVNAFTGVQISDPNRLVSNTDYQQNGFHNYRIINFLSAPDTWYDLGPVSAQQMWQVNVFDANDPSATRRQDLIYVSNAGAATVVNIFNINIGANVREVRVSGGVVQFRTTSTVSNTANTATAIRLA